MTREPATPEQLAELERSLTLLDAECRSLLDLVRTMYGAQEERTYRAHDLVNTFQRLRWAVDRCGNSKNGPQLEKALTANHPAAD